MLHVSCFVGQSWAKHLQHNAPRKLLRPHRFDCGTFRVIEFVSGGWAWLDTLFFCEIAVKHSQSAPAHICMLSKHY